MDKLKGLLQTRDYEKLEASERSDGSEDGITPNRINHQPRSTHAVLAIALTLLNIGSLVLHGILFSHSSSLDKPKRNQKLRDCSYFSPIFDRLDIPSTTKQINGTLTNEDDSIFRKPPSPEVDAAWDRISRLGYHTITTSDVLALGKDPTLTVGAPAHWNRGADAHLAQLDVTHQIHCLNAVRKAMYPAHYPPPSSDSGRLLLRDVHPQHCLHILLQNIMCDASLNVMTFNWMETQRNPFPDMGVRRECRDFEAVLGWHVENMVPVEEVVRRPKAGEGGVREVRLTPRLRELLEGGGDGTDGGG